MLANESNRTSLTWPDIARSIDRYKTPHQRVIEILQQHPEANDADNEPSVSGNANEPGRN